MRLTKTQLTKTQLTKTSGNGTHRCYMFIQRTQHAVDKTPVDKNPVENGLCIRMRRQQYESKKNKNGAVRTAKKQTKTVLC